MIKHTFYMGITTAVRLLTGIILFILLARLWGPHDFGLFMYWISVTSIMSMLVDYGFPTKILREVGKQPDQVSRVMGETLNAKIVLTCLLILFTALFSILKTQTRQESLLMWFLLLAAIAFSFGDMICTPFRAKGAFHQETIVVILSNALHFFFIAGVAKAGYGLELVAATFAVSRLLYLFLSFHSYRKIIGTLSWPKRKICSAYIELKTGWAYALDIGIANINSQIDTVLVRYFLGNYNVGIYQSGNRILQGTYTFSQVINNVFIPKISHEEHHPVNLKQTIAKLIVVMGMVGLAGYLVISLGAHQLQLILFGEKYNGLQILLPYFGLLILIKYVVASMGIALTGLGHQKLRVIAGLLSLISFISAAFLLVPKNGLIGVITALILSNLPVLFVYIYKLGFKSNLLSLNSVVLVIGSAIFVSLGVLF